MDKVASVTTVAVGDGSGPELFDWVLEVVNEGPDPAVGVVVNDIIPSSLTITGVSSSYFTCSTSGQTVNCTRDTMPPSGRPGTITVSVSLPDSAAAGAIENVANVTSNVPDPNLDNSDDAVVDVVAQQPLRDPGAAAGDAAPDRFERHQPDAQDRSAAPRIGAVGVLGACRRRGVTVG
ncbi:MAG: DUF11 domain-containing protein [Ilumatobacteraceae bacterium]